jgi:transcription factor SPN1
MQFDAILKPKKANRQKKPKKDDEEILDRFADEEVSRLREAMLGAAADDEQANRDKLPATNKLKLLPQVMEVLRKCAVTLFSCFNRTLIISPRQSLSQSIMDNNLLEGVRRWLEPLPDRSLPALNIQRDFFPILKRMEFIDSAVLKESGLGRVVLFYTKCKRVTSDVQRLANELVSTWSRPIIKRSASYRDRVVPVAEEDGTERTNERLNAILARAKEGEKNRIRKNAVMIPQKDIGTYTVAPRTSASVMKVNPSVDTDTVRRKVNAERLRTLSRKMATRA